MCLVLFAVAVASLLAAQSSSATGNRWKRQAQDAAAKVTPLQNALAQSESASKKAELRTTQLANEKAQAQDKLAIRAVLPADVTAVAKGLSDCANGTRDLLDAIGQAQSVTDLSGLNQQANDIAVLCTRAQAGADGLVDYLRNEAKK